MFWNHVSKQLSAYCHGELSPETSRRVAEHLMNCRRCRDEYEEIKFGAQLAQRLSEDWAINQAPAELWSELEAAMGRGTIHSGGAESAETSQRKTLLSLPSFKLSVATMALVMIGLAAFWYQARRGANSSAPKPSWEVTRIEGQPVVGSQAIGDVGKLALGEWLVTDDSSRARVDVGQIGMVTVEPNSRLKLAEARDDEHRLAMTRGKMSALIWAPPRQFYVDTPSAVAVDLGCAYTLEVNDDGQALLSVTAGWVAFESEGRESFVPRDGMCVTRPSLGPGTPYFSDASDEFKQALARFDTSGMDWSARGPALGIILYQARERDALTLWHLLSRTHGEERGLVYDKLMAFVPPPAGVTREGVLSRDKKMLDLWWENLGLGSADFWRMWKGPVPK